MDRLKVLGVRAVAGQVLKGEWISGIVTIVFVGPSDIWREVIIKIHEAIASQLSFFFSLYSTCQIMLTRAIQYSGKSRLVKKKKGKEILKISE